jgi:hypothetical protein
MRQSQALPGGLRPTSRRAGGPGQGGSAVSAAIELVDDDLATLLADDDGSTILTDD